VVAASVARGVLQPWRQAMLGAVAATREDTPSQLMPVSRACGRYVDWVWPSAAQQKDDQRGMDG
jgi:hypothetical protein